MPAIFSLRTAKTPSNEFKDTRVHGKNQRDIVRTQERQESDTITRIEQFNIDANKKMKTWKQH